MERILNIARSIARVHNAQILRLDINLIKSPGKEYLKARCWLDDEDKHTYDICEDGVFYDEL